MKRVFQLIFRIFVAIFALIGATTTAVFFAMQFDLLNVRGNIDDRNQFFYDAYKEQSAATQDSKKSDPSTTNPPRRIVRIISSNQEPDQEDATNNPLDHPCQDPTELICDWNETTEWAVIGAALRKDQATLKRVERETGVPARLIAAVVVPEQARFFSSNREVFKRWFEPMKLLGSLSQFSLGVSGIKQETAKRIEEHANNPDSSLYPGDTIAPLLSYPDEADHNETLYDRLTDEDDHYYSYLYTAAFVKEIITQWERAGFPINNRPDVIITLFNLGFDRSKPHDNPTAGGATLSIGGTNYTYGTLGNLFYRSEELTDIFPQESDDHHIP
jgi:hypothetical protein